MNDPLRILALITAATMEGVRVLHLGREVGRPSPAEVEAAWTPEMIVTCLGHDLDGDTAYFHPELIDLPWMDALVRRLAEVPGWVDLAEYFGARIAFAREAFGAALQRLESLAEREAHGAPYPFPMALWRHRYRLSEAIAPEPLERLVGRRPEAINARTRGRRAPPAGSRRRGGGPD